MPFHTEVYQICAAGAWRARPDARVHGVRSPAEVEIAVAQYLPGTDKSENLQLLRGYAEHAAQAGAQVLVAPEFAMYGVDQLDERLVAAAEPLDGNFATAISEIAVANGVAVVAGLAERSPDPARAYNTMVAVGAAGEVLAAYRKVHLYDAFGSAESAFIRPGEPSPLSVFSVAGMIFGLQTCYDLRFPELSRCLAAAGAHVLLVGAQWGRGPLKTDHWLTLLRARAIENTVFVAAAGQPPPLGNGCSLVADPEGVILAGLGTEPGLARARLSLAQLDLVRERNPSLRHRRLKFPG